MNATQTAVRRLTPVEIRVLSALRKAREPFVCLADIVIDSDDPLFAVKAALTELRRRGYATSSDSRWACTGVGEYVLDMLPAAVRAQALQQPPPAPRVRA